MATAEHREPCDSRGSRTVLGAAGGAIPPADSPIALRINDATVTVQRKQKSTSLGIQCTESCRVCDAVHSTADTWSGSCGVGLIRSRPFDSPDQPRPTIGPSTLRATSDCEQMNNSGSSITAPVFKPQRAPACRKNRVPNAGAASCSKGLLPPQASRRRTDFVGQTAGSGSGLYFRTSLASISRSFLRWLSPPFGSLACNPRLREVSLIFDGSRWIGHGGRKGTEPTAKFLVTVRPTIY